MPKRAKRASTCVLVLGSKGSGKTWWSQTFVRQLAARELVLVWDPNGEWAGPAAERPLPGARTFTATPELLRWITEHNPRAAGKRLVVQSPHLRDFDLLCRLAHAAGDLWLVVDEAAKWCRAAVIPESLRELLQLSRHRRVNVLLIAQRPTHLHPDLRDNKDRTVLFHMPGEASLAWVRGEFGKSAESATRKLRPRAYLDFRKGDPLLGGEPAERSPGRSGARPGTSTKRTRP